MGAIFRRDSDGRYPLTPNDIRNFNRNISLPKEPTDVLMKSLGYSRVFLAEKPDADVVSADTPVMSEGGTWSQGWVGRRFTPEELDEILQTKRSEMVVTMRQAKRALLNLNLLEGVQEAINTLPEPERSEANVDWNTAQEVERLWPFVVSLGPALSLTEEDLDNLFTLAATF